MTSEPEMDHPAKPYISVVIPALNEQAAIGGVVRAVPREITDEVIVVDNGSDDFTGLNALNAGARVVREPRRGYGRACKMGVNSLAPESEIVVFLDGDGSDRPELLLRLVEPIISGSHDFVIGSRTRGSKEPGSLSIHQVFAGRAAGLLIQSLYGARYTDMCPFRAIRRAALERLPMREETYGWNLEMQMLAARAGLRILEVPVDCQRRQGGRSKVSGTFRGSMRAAIRIASTFLRVACLGNPR